MVAEPWIHKLRSLHTKSPSPKPSPHPSSTTTTIAILSFEVAATMSRTVHLHRSLSDTSLAHLHSPSPAILALVNPNINYILTLALAEKLSDLNRIAAATALLGRRCTHPALVGFHHVYADLLANRIPDPSALGFLSKDIEGSIRRMERLVSNTTSLFTELENLNELQQSNKRYTETETCQVVDEKIELQRNRVGVLRDGSLWSQDYDKVVILLARAVCSIYVRIRRVFSEVIDELDLFVPERSWMLSPSPCRHIPLHSGPIGKSGLHSGQICKLGVIDVESGRRRGTSPGRRLMNCLSLASSGALDSGRFEEGNGCLSRTGSGGQVTSGSPRLRFGPKTKLMELALPSTVGGSSLALHYANVIIIIQKLLRYPHLVGDETREDLYQMLPTSLRMALKRSLKLYVKNHAIYDAPLAHNWKDALDKILSWLAPMAHNMIQWQTDRNFEQQQIVSRANVLLLETLYFADREKTEAAICELLVGLNYICRYEQQQNALMDCTSSADFDVCMEWQMQY